MSRNITQRQHAYARIAQDLSDYTLIAEVFKLLDGRKSYSNMGRKLNSALNFLTSPSPIPFPPKKFLSLMTKTKTPKSPTHFSKRIAGLAMRSRKQALALAPHQIANKGEIHTRARALRQTQAIIYTPAGRGKRRGAARARLAVAPQPARAALSLLSRLVRARAPRPPVYRYIIQTATACTYIPASSSHSRVIWAGSRRQG